MKEVAPTGHEERGLEEPEEDEDGEENQHLRPIRYIQSTINNQQTANSKKQSDIQNTAISNQQIAIS